MRSTPIRPYLETRTAAPSGWSPDDRRVLISSDLPGTHQVHWLDINTVDVPVRAKELVRITDLLEPTYAAPTSGRRRAPVPPSRGQRSR